MNMKERNTIHRLQRQADELLNSGRSVNPRVTNLDVLEALLTDLQAFSYGREPKELTELIRIESEESK